MIAKLQTTLESRSFEWVITALILINAVILGLETSSAIMATWGPILVGLDQVLLAIFVAELALKLVVYRQKFFKSGWNLFDFIIIAIALVPAYARADGSIVRQGINDYTGWFAGDKDMGGDYYGYDGPCPPWNDSVVHHYVFTLYALNVPCLELHADIEKRFTGADVLRAMEGKILAQASITGRYSLNPAVPL